MTDGPTTSGTDAPALEQPVLAYLGTLRVEVGEPVVVGETVDGVRRIIPILGGTFTGPRATGRILPGGADYQLIRSATLTELEAKYAVELDGGERLYIDNLGLRSASPEDTAAIARGESVPAERVYFRSAMRIHGPGELGTELAERIVIATGRRLPDAVVLDLHVVG